MQTIRTGYLVLGIVTLVLLLGGVGLVFFAQQRLANCAYIPLFAPELLPNADLALRGDPPSLPQGWQAGAPGVQLGEFAVDGDERALQLIGIANYVQTPPISVQAGQSYCFRGLAMTDSVLGSATQLQVVFRWLNAEGELLAEQQSDWQPVVLWQPDNPPEHWSSIGAAFLAPPGASTLHVRLRPASDDRIYLDAMHVRPGGIPAIPPEDLRAAEDANQPALPALMPWPAGQRAALSFSFDWETAMGGLVHSRSVGDPNVDQDPILRGLRMREGITTTIDIFQPHGIRATYYATGYNFLLGNTEQITFMGDPTYSWANSDNRWTSDRWQTTPWFAPDPYGSFISHPAWYFGDLVPRVREAEHDIQSHTFSHFYGGFVRAEDWQADIDAWHMVAAAQDVPPMRSLAFPWSSSGGMSAASWEALRAAGITSVTRTSEQSQYNFFPRNDAGLVHDPHCRPLPAYETIMVCPDFYLTPASAEQAIAQINHTLAVSGTIDLWAHTEEVVSPEQRDAWERVVNYAAIQPDLWIAPLAEITDWQHALRQVRISHVQPFDSRRPDMPLRFRLVNASSHDLHGLSLRMPFAVGELALNGEQHTLDAAPPAAAELLTTPASAEAIAAPVRCLPAPARCYLTLRAGETLEVAAWPSR
jgi:hypothetical protein